MAQQIPLVKRTVNWIDAHPRTGWYVAIVTTINLVVTFLSLFNPH